MFRVIPNPLARLEEVGTDPNELALRRSKPSFHIQRQILGRDILHLKVGVDGSELA